MNAGPLFHRCCHVFLNAVLPEVVLPLPFVMGPLKGMVMRICLNSERQFLRGNFENEVTKTIQDVVKPGNIVYDVGAHVGYHTLLFARLVGPNGHCLAFEPSRKVFGRLKANIQMNKRRIQDRVETMEVALYSECGQKEFFVGGSTSTGRLVRFPREASAQTIVSVPVTTIDNLVANGAPTPDVVKIDVEYVEDHVIRGANNTLRNHHAIILCEIHSIESGINCFNTLRKLSYEMRHLEGDRPWNSTESVSTGHIIAVPQR